MLTKDSRNRIIIEEIFRRSDDNHCFFTPFSLCDEMVNKLIQNTQNYRDKIYLVVANLEFIHTLLIKGVPKDNIWFASPCNMKITAAKAFGVGEERIIQYDYDYTDFDEIKDVEMKFDVVIMNPPYNPNHIWAKFVQLGIDFIRDNGTLVAIHPSTWRESSKFDKLMKDLRNNIIELHIMDYEVFKVDKIALKTDWYIYKKGYSGKQTVFYSNGSAALVDLREERMIMRFSPTSNPATILQKIAKAKNNGVILLGRNGYHPLYKKHTPVGRYKQCGVEGNGTGWTENKFGLTEESSEHQFEDKVVIAYAGKPRAKYFSGTEEVGVVRAHYWLTDNQSLPILLNSKMFWKLVLSISDPDQGMFKPYGAPPALPTWLLKSIDFDSLNVTTEQELYTHYGLTKEEIEWCET